jgi:hypothetical protein
VLALFFLCAIVFGQMEAYAQTEPAKKESKAKARKRKNSKKVRKAGRRQKSDQSQYSGTISQQRTSSGFGLVDGSKKDPPRRNRKNRKARQKYFRKSNYSWAGPQSSPAGRRRYNNRSQRMSGGGSSGFGMPGGGYQKQPTARRLKNPSYYGARRRRSSNRAIRNYSGNMQPSRRSGSSGFGMVGGRKQGSFSSSGASAGSYAGKKRGSASSYRRSNSSLSKYRGGMKRAGRYGSSGFAMVGRQSQGPPSRTASKAKKARRSYFRTGGNNSFISRSASRRNQKYSGNTQRSLRAGSSGFAMMRGQRSGPPSRTANKARKARRSYFRTGGNNAFISRSASRRNQKYSGNIQRSLRAGSSGFAMMGGQRSGPPSRTANKARKARRSYFQSGRSKALTAKSASRNIQKYSGNILTSPRQKRGGFTMVGGSSNRSQSVGASRTQIARKSYFKAQKNQLAGSRKASKDLQKYSGNIFVSPRSKRNGFAMVAGEAEKNPSLESRKARKARESIWRSKSRQQNSRAKANIPARKNRLQGFQFSSAITSRSFGDRAVRKNRTDSRSASKNSQKYSGNIFVAPRGKRNGFAMMSGEAEKNPSLESRRARKAREAIWQTKSRQQSKRFGLNIPARRNRIPDFRYTSSMASKSTGDQKMRRSRTTGRSLSRNLAQVERKNQKAWRSVERASARKQNTKKGVNIPARRNRVADYRFSAAITSKSRGDLKMRRSRTTGRSLSGNLAQVERKNQKAWRSVERASARRQNTKKGVNIPARRNRVADYRFSAAITSKSRGDLKMPQKSMGNPNLQRYKGDFTQTSPKAKQRQRKYVSMLSAKYRGNFSGRRSAPSSNSASNYRGDVKTKGQLSLRRNDKFKSKPYSKYNGELSLRRSNRTPAANPFISRYQGDLIAISASQRRRTNNFNSKLIASFAGETRPQGRVKYASTVSRYSGNVDAGKLRKSAKSTKGKSGLISAFQGNIPISAREREKADYKYTEAINRYRGEINQRVYANRQDRSRSKSEATAAYQGNINATLFKLRDKQYEHQSRNIGNYRGNLTVRRQSAQNRYDRRLSARNQRIEGNLRAKTQWALRFQQRSLTARVSNYEGESKTGFFNRLWSSLFDNNGKQIKADNKVKKPKYDSREYKIWY